VGRSFGSSLWPGRLGAAPVHERCERPSTALTQSIEVGAVPDSGLAERMQVRAPPRVAQPLCLDPVRENERRWDQSRRALPAEMSRSHSRHPSPRASPPPREAGLPTSSGDGQPVSGNLYPAVFWRGAEHAGVCLGLAPTSSACRGQGALPRVVDDCFPPFGGGVGSAGNEDR